MKVQLRSRYRSYRWRDVEFYEHRAEVSEATFAQMQKDKALGVDFWRDDVEAVKAAAARASGGASTDAKKGGGKPAPAKG